MKIVSGIMIMLMLCSCASSYTPLHPNSTYYSNAEEANGVTFSYKHGVLAETGNRKYAKREVSKALKVVSVKIVNNGDKELIIGENAKFYSGNSELRLADPGTLHHQLKQGVPIYLLYLLLTPMNLYTSSNGKVTSTPIGLVIGPAISFGNMIGAGAANQNFLKELEQFNLINKKIAPGQTVYGLIGINDMGYNPVKLVVAP